MLSQAILALPPATIAILTAIFFAGGIVKGITGVGLPLFLIPLTTQFIDPPAAVALLSVPMVATNIAQSMEGGETIKAIRRLVPILLPLIAGGFIGVHLLLGIDRRVLNLVLGCSFIALSLLLLATPRVRLAPKTARLLGPFAGLTAGLLGGMSAMFGPPMIAYLVWLGVEPRAFVKYMAILALTASLTLLLTLSGAGALSPADALISAAAILPIQLGMPVGRWLRGRIRPEVFRTAVLAMLAAGGLDLLRRALS